VREERGSLSQGPEERIVLEWASILEGADIVDVHRGEEAVMGRYQLGAAETAGKQEERRTLALQLRHGRWH
jgi:hypothetical protein